MNPLVVKNNICVSHCCSHSFRPPPLHPLPSSPRFKFSAAVTKPRTLTFALTRHSTHLLKMDESSTTDSYSSNVHQEYAEIVVVRHGETAWNADGRIQGHLDVELNEAGRQQAAVVADRLSKEPKISVIYSSDLQRAFETAQIIASRCGGLEVVKDSDLRERHLGDLQGLIYRDAAKSNPMAHKAMASRNEDQEIPGGGESLAQLFQRCTSALQRIGKKHQGERVLVVSHGGFIRSLYRWACPNGRPAGKIHNTSVNVFHLYGDDKWTLKSWGDVSHLRQTGFLESGFGGDRTSGKWRIWVFGQHLSSNGDIKALSWSTVDSQDLRSMPKSSPLLFVFGNMKERQKTRRRRQPPDSQSMLSDKLNMANQSAT